MKTVIKGYEYRIYPTEEQKELINKTFGCFRFIYNYFLAMKIELYKTDQKSLSYNQCSELLTELKKEKEWLKEVDKFSLQNSLKDLNTAYQNFFREHKKGNTNQGFPKFKSKKNNYKSYRTNFTNNNIEIDFEKGQIKLPKANNSIGLDLGISDLLITSNRQTFENNKLTYKYEKKLAKLQRQLSKKQKGSKNFNKQRIKIAKLYEKITNIRVDNLHKISSQIVKENQFIFSEDLNIKSMVKNPNLSKSIHDASWSELTRQLQYKSEWNNGLLAGLYRSEAKERFPLPEGRRMPHDKFAQSESYINFRARAEMFWSKFIHEYGREENNTRICIVSHGGMINMLFRSFMMLPVNTDSYINTGDTGLHLWKINGNERRIIFLNKQEHLLGLNAD